MATYVPGVPSYMPNWKPFTPDYKFLSDVLTTKTDKYNTNYKAINDLYSKVVYADLSREDTQGLRDQYANDLGVQMQKISGMDLSVMQNVDAAKALFRPFYEEDIIVMDLMQTKNIQKQMQHATELKNSMDQDMRDMYSPDSVEALNYKMQDFINASEKEALEMGLPRYSPNVNLHKMTMAWLNEQDYEVTLPSMSPDGKWIIHNTNGALITKQALADATAALASDPRVQESYYVNAYVQSRRFADKAIKDKKATSVAEGMSQWGKEQLTKTTDELGAKVVLLNKDRDILLKSKTEWDDYDEKTGIIEGSPQDIYRQETDSALEANTLNIEMYKAAIQQATQIITDNDGGEITNKAYNIMMANNIQADLTAAALAYSEKTKSQKLELNQYKVNEIKFNNDIYLKKLAHQFRMDEIGYKAQLDKDQTDYENQFNDEFDKLTEGVFGEASTTTLPLGLDPNYTQNLIERETQENTKLINDEAALVSSLVEAQQRSSVKNNEYMLDGWWEGDGLNRVQTSDGWQTTVTGDKLQGVLADSKNQEQFKSLYQAESTKVSALPKNATPEEQDVVTRLFTQFQNLNDRRYRLEHTSEKVNGLYYKNWQELDKNIKYKFMYNEDVSSKGLALAPSMGMGSGYELTDIKPETVQPHAIIRHNREVQSRKALFKTDKDGENPRIRTEEEFVNAIMQGDTEVREDIREGYHKTRWMPNRINWWTYWIETDDKDLRKHLGEKYKDYTTELNKATAGRYNIPVTAKDVEGANFQFSGATFDDVYTENITGEAGDLVLYPSISAVLTPGRLDKQDVEMYKNYTKQLNHGLDNTFLSGITLEDVSTPLDRGKALAVLNAATDHIRKRSSKTGAAKDGIGIIYNKGSAIGGDPTNRQATYTVNIPSSVLKPLTESSGSDTRQHNIILHNELPDYSQIVIAFPVESDLNPQSIQDSKFSNVVYKVKSSPNKAYTRRIPNGGEYTVRLTNGQYKVDITTDQFKVGGPNNVYGIYPTERRTDILTGSKLMFDESMNKIVQDLLQKGGDNVNKLTQHSKKVNNKQ